jgi:dihydrofolate synthase/folylpolyglutamate synthase
VITAIAFLYFKDKKLDYLVCEVGMGGRLDATNTVRPLISVITNIGLEHQEYLGKTVEKIAYEKAGIIKKKVPVVTGAKGIAFKVMKKIARRNNSRLYISKPVNWIKLKLRGDFQLINASIAIETIRVLNKEYNLKINKKQIKDGLLKTIWHGRLEFIERNVLIDCAHNLEGIKTLKKELSNIKYDNLYLITGFLKNKDHKNMLKELTPLAKEVILVKPKIPRAIDPKELTKYTKNYRIINDTKEALRYAKKLAKKDDLILITGSIYVVSEVV